MTDWSRDFWPEVTSRLTGPLAMRFYLQPVLPTLFAVRDGFRDAVNGRPAYFWAIFSNSKQRRHLLRDGWKAVGRIFLLAVAVDFIYQLLALRSLHLSQAVLVATMLALGPYILLRGPINRIVRTLKLASTDSSGRGSKAA